MTHTMVFQLRPPASFAALWWSGGKERRTTGTQGSQEENKNVVVVLVLVVVPVLVCGGVERCLSKSGTRGSRTRTLPMMRAVGIGEAMIQASVLPQPHTPRLTTLPFPSTYNSSRLAWPRPTCGRRELGAIACGTPSSSSTSQPPLNHHPVLLLLDPTTTINHAFARGHQHGLPAPLQVLVQGGKEAPTLEPEAGRKRVLQGEQLCLDGAGQQHWYVHREGKRKEGRRKKRREGDRWFGCGAPAMICVLIVSAGFCMEARAQW